MRLTLPALLSLLCAGVLACDGPTSDWPGKHHGDPDSPPENSGSGPAPSNPATGGKGGTEGPGLSLDAGVVAEQPPRAGMDPVTVVPGGDVDAGSVHVEPADGGDAGAHDAGEDAGASDASDSSDAGVGSDASAPSDAGSASCDVDSDARDAGGCFGVYCATTAEQLSENLSAAGQCRSADDLALVCDGELTRVIAACAQDDALDLGFGSTVTSCARSEPSLSKASDGCIDCYVDELICAVQSCLTPCLAGLSPTCTACRIEHCGQAFSICSGLPRP